MAKPLLSIVNSPDGRRRVLIWVLAFLMFSSFAGWLTTREDDDPVEIEALNGGRLTRAYNLVDTHTYLAKPRAWQKRQVVFDEIERYGEWPDDLLRKTRLVPFEPVVHCTDEDRLGRLGDGGKVVCAINRLPRGGGCIVYSFGCGGDPSFEQELDGATGGRCEIHTLDPDPSYARLWRAMPKNLHYHAWRAGNELSLADVMKRLSHTHIDILKVDIEGDEYGLLHEAFKHDSGWPSVSQIIVEVHEIGKKTARRTFELVKLLERRGFYQFHSEVTPSNPRACRELSFINVTAPQFTSSSSPTGSDNNTAVMAPAEDVNNAVKIQNRASPPAGGGRTRKY
jgi:hypothetical protein